MKKVTLKVALLAVGVLAILVTTTAATASTTCAVDVFGCLY